MADDGSKDGGAADAGETCGRSPGRSGVTTGGDVVCTFTDTQDRRDRVEEGWEGTAGNATVSI